MGERDVAAALLDRMRRNGALRGDELVIADKGFSGAELEQIVQELAAQLLRPDRKNEQLRNGNLGRVRQWIESIYDTTKDQLSLERHGGRTLDGVWARICQRILALAAGVWNNWQHGQPGRSFTAYDH